MSSLYTIHLDLDAQYIPMINDLLRIFTIQIVAQLMFGLTRKGPSFSFLSEIFLQTLVFLLLGVLVYWLCIHKIIQFQSARQT